MNSSVAYTAMSNKSGLSAVGRKNKLAYSNIVLKAQQ